MTGNRTEKRYVIGYDVGTGGCKAVLVTLDGSIEATEFEPYEVAFPQDHYAEQDPADWWRAVCETTGRLVGKARVDPSEVMGLAFASQMLGVVPVGQNGEPLCPGIIWMDSRAEKQAARLVRRMGGRKVLMTLLGVVPSGKDVPCKFKWVEEDAPEIFARTMYFLDVKGYLVWRATGSYEYDQTACSVTGFMDSRTRGWSGLAAKVLGGRLDKMPPVKGCTEIAGELTDAAAAEMGLAAGTPVASGMGDAPAAIIGAGALSHGECVVSIGTSGLLLINSEKKVNLGRNGMASIASSDPEMWLLTGEMITTGSCLKWFAEQLVSPGERERAGEGGIYAELDRVVTGVPAGSRRLIFTPWMYGERAPVTDNMLRGAYVNLSLDHTRDDMLRALYEGVAMNFRWGFEAAARKKLPCPTVRVIGGGALSDPWMQIFADVTGRVMEPVEGAQEAGALGAALSVPLALGVYPDYAAVREAVKVRRRFEPDRSKAPVYDELFEQFQRLYDGLAPVYHELNRM
ncbi:MAG: FGGY-family carbohydrate kinase [Actinomycetota bacterium]